MKAWQAHLGVKNNSNITFYNHDDGQWRNRRGCRRAQCPPAAFTGLAKQSYWAGEDIEEGGREKGRRQKKNEKREKKK